MTQFIFGLLVASSAGCVFITVKPRQNRSMAIGSMIGRNLKSNRSRIRDIGSNMSRSDMLESYIRTIGLDWAGLESRRWRTMVMWLVFAFVLGAVGVSGLIVAIPWYMAAVMIIFAGMVGWWVPSVLIRSEAKKANEAFAYALGGWLNIVAMLLNGGLSMENAIKKAAILGGGIHYDTLRVAIGEAEGQGLPLWHMFRFLEQKHPIQPVKEMLSSCRLATSRGMAVSQPLQAKAEGLRTEQRLQKRRHAEQVTARMKGPSMAFTLLPMMGMLYGIMQKVQAGFN